jgi:hypothetical protein
MSYYTLEITNHQKDGDIVGTALNGNGMAIFHVRRSAEGLLTAVHTLATAAVVDGLEVELVDDSDGPTGGIGVIGGKFSFCCFHRRSPDDYDPTEPGSHRLLSIWLPRDMRQRYPRLNGVALDALDVIRPKECYKFFTLANLALHHTQAGLATFSRIYKPRAR